MEYNMITEWWENCRVIASCYVLAAVSIKVLLIKQDARFV
jgi:hypothetical protein